MLTTVQRVKDHLLGVGEAVPASHEPSLTSMVAGVSSNIENMLCGRKFAQATYAAELHTGLSGQTLLYFEEWPVTTVTTVTLDGVTIVEGTGAENYIKHRSREGVDALYRKNGWESEPYGISLTYIAGYVLLGQTNPTLPEDLILAATELVAATYQQRGKSGLATESFEGLSQTFERLPPRIKDTLRYYKRPKV